MSLNRYHNSRSSDNVFKLLHEESSYLDILKGNVKSVYQDEIGEDKAVGSHDVARQQLLHEQDPGLDAVEDSKVDEKPEEKEGTPDQQEKAVEKATDAVGDIKEESIDQMIEDELEEISIAVARQAGRRIAQKRGLAAKGILGAGRRSTKAKRAVIGLR